MKQTLKKKRFRKSIGMIFLALSITGGYASMAQVVGSSNPDSKMLPGSNSPKEELNNIYVPNLFEGTANIGIPIFQYDKQGGSFGISLGYNTKGVKVDEVSSAAGTHWNINTGGSITRVVKDIPDELFMVSGEDSINLGDTMVINKNKYVKGKLVLYTETPAQQLMQNVYKDKECDDYIVSVGDLSFVFNLGSDMNVFTHPHRNVQVTPTLNGNAIFTVNAGFPDASYMDNGIPRPAPYGYKIGFIIRDEKGNQFFFEQNEYKYPKLETNEYFGRDYIGSYYRFDNWFLSKVIFADGQDITYEFLDYHPGASFNGYKQDYVVETRPGNPNATFALSMKEDGPAASRQIDKITYPNGIKAQFVYSSSDKTESNARMLKEVQISEGPQCKRYQLSQSKVNGRWFLNAVRIANCANTYSENYYKFEYDPMSLPPRLNSAQDFYGYYNGDSVAVPAPYSTSGVFYADATKIMIPKHDLSNPYPTYGMGRYFNLNYAKAGVLTKVKNAYGGELLFKYAANSGFGYLPTTPPTGLLGESTLDGLRLDTIIESDKFHPGSFKKTVISYQLGMQFMPGGHFHFPQYINSQTNVWEKVFYQNFFLTAHQTINGANHGYSTVDVRSYNESDQLLGHKQFKFSNMSDVTSDFQPRYYKLPGAKEYWEYPYTDKQYLKDWEIGQVLSETEYDQSDKVLQNTINQYASTAIDLSAATYISNTKTTLVNTGTAISTGGQFYPEKKIFTESYYPFTATSLLQKTIIHKYISDAEFIADTIWYNYDQRNNLKETIAKNSLGEEIKMHQVYNYDAGGEGVIAGAPLGSALYNMTNTGIEKVISRERWKEGEGTYPTNMYGQKLLDASIDHFEFYGGILRPKAFYALQTGSAIDFTPYTGMSMGGSTVNRYNRAISAYSGTTPANFLKSTEVLKYDAKSNPLEIRLLDNDKYKAMLWDMETGNKLADATNARWNEIAYSSFESNNTGNLTYAPSLVVASSDVVTGTRKLTLPENTATPPISVSGLTPGKDYYLTFWCKNIGAPSVNSNIAGNITSTTAGNSINGWYFRQAKFKPTSVTEVIGIRTIYSNTFIDEVRVFPADALMESWTYVPLFGAGSATAANGRVTFQEYDELGRPVVVKDQDGAVRSKVKYINNGVQ